MQSTLITSLIKSAQDVLKVTVGSNIHIGEPFTRTPQAVSDVVGICVGLTGEIRGQIVFSMKKEIACNVASQMMVGASIKELDEVSRSAVSELCNMIMGSTAAILFQNGIDIDITPPAFLQGENLSYLATSKVTTLCIPFEVNTTIKIDVEVFIEKND